jgi:protein arginine kinase activator
MLCQICKKNPASVHVTEISTPNAPAPEASDDGSSQNGPPPPPAPTVEQRHLCERCAQRMKLPHSPVLTNKGMAVWKLLKESARRAREEGGLACPDCGMTLAEFRSKGRLGCPRDYEVFARHLEPLLLRIHNAAEHQGRLPGQDEDERKRQAHLTQLRAQLQEAIRSEAYENAAQLRDAIQQLETQPESGS